LLVYAAGGLAEVRIYTDGRGEFQKLATDKAASRAAARNRSPLGTESSAGNVAKAATPEPQPANPTPPSPQPTISDLRAEALRNPDPEQRVAGLDELADSDNPEVALETAAKVLESERVSDVLESALNIFAGNESAPIEPVLKFASGDQVKDTAI